MDIGECQGQGRLQNRKECIQKRGLHFPYLIILTGINSYVLYNNFVRFGLQYSYSEWYEFSYTSKLGDDQDNDLSRTYAFREYKATGEFELD